MPNQHKYTPLRLRLPAALRERFDAYVKRTGRKTNAVLVEAAREYLDRNDPVCDTPGTASESENDR
jgi:predicted DNA-binding protein